VIIFGYFFFQYVGLYTQTFKYGALHRKESNEMNGRKHRVHPLSLSIKEVGQRVSFTIHNWLHNCYGFICLDCFKLECFWIMVLFFLFYQQKLMSLTSINLP